MELKQNKYDSVSKKKEIKQNEAANSNKQKEIKWMKILQHSQESRERENIISLQ